MKSTIKSKITSMRCNYITTNDFVADNSTQCLPIYIFLFFFQYLLKVETNCSFSAEKLSMYNYVFMLFNQHHLSTLVIVNCPLLLIQIHSTFQMFKAFTSTANFDNIIHIKMLYVILSYSKNLQ